MGGDVGASLGDAALTGMTAALIGAAFAWCARCGQQFHEVEASFRARVEKLDAAQEERIGAALGLIMQAALQPVVDLYLERYRPHAAVTADDLRHAAAEMKRDPDAVDYTVRELVTRPVWNGLLADMTAVLPAIAGSVRVVPAVDGAIRRLGCYAGSMAGIYRRAKRLSWLFGLQAVLIAVALATLAIPVGVGVPVDFVAAAWVLVIARGLWLEIALHRLANEVAVVPPILGEAWQ